jgi:hypothetical protein
MTKRSNTSGFATPHVVRISYAKHAPCTRGVQNQAAAELSGATPVCRGTWCGPRVAATSSRVYLLLLADSLNASRSQVAFCRVWRTTALWPLACVCPTYPSRKGGVMETVLL